MTTFLFGRNNLALTVFVPYDCPNHCPFCTSKPLYAGANAKNVEYQLKRVLGEFRYPIKDVVFTGGEPMADVGHLAKLIDTVPGRYNVYINTCLTEDHLYDFVALVNKCDKIKGVNVSRHGESYGEDRKLLHGIAGDDAVRLFKKPVRINCVVCDQNIDAVIERWQGTNVNLCFRKDYRIPQTQTELHNLYEPFMLDLVARGFRYYNHVQCNVCDTTRFEHDGFMVTYHKGLQHSSILTGDVLELNDIIINPDGHVAYDWDGCDLELMNELEAQMGMGVRYHMANRHTYNHSVCGGGGCYSGVDDSGCGSGGC